MKLGGLVFWIIRYLNIFHDNANNFDHVCCAINHRAMVNGDFPPQCYYLIKTSIHHNFCVYRIIRLLNEDCLIKEFILSSIKRLRFACD